MPGSVRVEGPAIAGVTGDLSPIKARADFVESDHDRLVDQKGARFAWARAMRCPCESTSRQTQQPDPNCSLCLGRGFAFFGPYNYEIPAAVGDLDLLQTSIIEEHGSAVIRGVITQVERRDVDFGKLGPWIWGSALVSVRSENILGRWDRLVDLDSEMAFSEVIEVEYTTSAPIVPLPIPTRYPVVAFNAGLDDVGSRYRLGVHLSLSERGVLTWRDGFAPEAGTRIGIHYLCHTVWRVMEEPHVVRRTSILEKVKKPTTPLGSPTALPIQALIRLEYLTEENVGG